MLRLLTTICLLALLFGTGTLKAQTTLRVDIQGLDAELEKNVRAFLTIEQQKKAKDLSDQRIRRYHARAAEEIGAALQPFGYYQPQIESSLTRKNGNWIATYSVDAGTPVQISTIDISVEGPGQEEPRLREVLQALKLKTGIRLVHAEYEQARSRLQSTALELGYRDAIYTQREVRVMRASNSAEVTLHLATGDKYFFGPVTFQGSELREQLLRAYIPFQQGDPWSNRKMLDFQRILADTNYFSNIEILPMPEQTQQQQIPVQVTLTPRKKQRYSIGVGYTTNTGPRLTLAWYYRPVNRRGHRFEAASEVSRIRQSLSAKYSIPLSRPRTDVLDFIGTTRRDETDTTQSYIHELRTSRAIQRGKVQTTTYLSFKRETYEIGKNDDDKSSDLLIPGVVWNWVDADSRLVTRNGNRVQLEIKGAGKAFASDTTFTQALLQPKMIRPLGANGRIILRADLGGTALGDAESLPASNRFFAGGDNSVRGYAYEDLGPKDNDGEVTGGSHLLVGSVEYNHRVHGKWHAAMFFDAGNAFNDLPFDEQRGVGVGIRWESPVGMLRLDVASALSKEDNPLRLHFTFGPDL